MHRVRLRHLVRVFAWLGATSVGGGRTGYFHESLVVRHGWTDNDEFLQDLTICQLLPGPNVSNLAVAIGYRLAGLAGSVWAWLALLTPGALMVLGLTLLYFRRGLDVHAAVALRGMGAAVAALMLVTNLRIFRGARHGRTGIAIAVTTFVAVAIFRVNTAVVVAVLAGVGVWLHRPRADATIAPTPDDASGAS
jgi:chromate transporter